MALCWLDEGLATAIGNGICYKDMTGHLEKQPWYQDPIIDTFARAITPAVEQYFLSKAPADLMVMATFQRHFLREFPTYMRRAEILFPYEYVVAPNRNALEQFREACNTSFTLRGTQDNYPVSEENLAGVNRESPPGTRIIIVADKAAAIKIDRVLGLKEPMAQKALQLGRPAKATSKSDWPLIFIPMKQGKLLLDVSKLL
jgi:hypothetical protein